jgi:hypothetical protein
VLEGKILLYDLSDLDFDLARFQEVAGGASLVFGQLG